MFIYLVCVGIAFICSLRVQHAVVPRFIIT